MSAQYDSSSDQQSTAPERLMHHFGLVQPDVLDPQCPLGSNAKLVYACMTIFAGRDRGGVRPSVPTLAGMASLSESTARRALKELEAAGLAVATEKGKTDGNGGSLPTVWRLRDSDSAMEHTTNEDGSWIGWGVTATGGVTGTAPRVSQGHQPPCHTDTPRGVTGTGNQDQLVQDLGSTKGSSSRRRSATAKDTTTATRDATAPATTWTTRFLDATEPVLVAYREGIAAKGVSLPKDQDAVIAHLDTAIEKHGVDGALAFVTHVLTADWPQSTKTVGTYLGNWDPSRAQKGHSGAQSERERIIARNRADMDQQRAKQAQRAAQPVQEKSPEQVAESRQRLVEMRDSLLARRSA